MAEVGTLTDEATKRKERLLALKKRASKPSDDEPSEKKVAQGEALPRLVNVLI